MSIPVHALRNIGPTTAQWLEEIGIRTDTELADLGVVEAYRRIAAAHSDRVSLNLLWSLQAALLDLPWDALPAGVKEELLRQLDQ